MVSVQEDAGMTTQFDFSNDDWEQVARTPLLVGMAVAKAEDSGFFGSIRETRSLLGTIAEGDEDNPARQLIDQVSAADTEADFAAYKLLTPEALATDAEDACRLLVNILDAVAGPQEADGFKRWVLGVAESVAEAAKEHGTRVSPGEVAVIDVVAEALGLGAS
jgi:hypothetical protein